MAIFSRLKAKREANGITQVQLAIMLGITQGAVSQWEAGQTKPNIELLPKLADILGCTVDELLRGGEKEVN